MTRSADPLTPFEARLVLSLCPAGTRIVRAAYFPHHAYPCPVRVKVALPHGGRHEFVVRMVRSRRGSLNRELALFPLLARLGLPVPQVLAGPVGDPGDVSRRPVAVLSLLPGENLQRMAERGGRWLARARGLLLEGVDAIHALTHAVRASSAGHWVPRGTLSQHLALVAGKRGPWQAQPVFRDAVRRLTPVLGKIRTPLAFTNGDYQPANFLGEGERLSGVLDFEFAWFQDPLYGFSKFPILDLVPLARAGVVEAFLRRHGFSRREFAPRVALACLAVLSRDLPVTGGRGGERDRVLRVLLESLRGL